MVYDTARPPESHPWPPERYRKKSHSSRPLYSLRFLSARRPKARSNPGSAERAHSLHPGWRLISKPSSRYRARGALAIAQALAIGRVEQEHPGGAFQRERLEVLAVYADATLQPCLADMPSAQRKRFGVNVAAGDGKRRVRTEGLRASRRRASIPARSIKG